MSAFVGEWYRAECFECGWWGDDHDFRSEARDDAEKHDSAHHPTERES